MAMYSANVSLQVSAALAMCPAEPDREMRAGQDQFSWECRLTVRVDVLKPGLERHAQGDWRGQAKFVTCREHSQGVGLLIWQSWHK